ncbi:hypothetical protein SAMN04487852_10463 [Prevotella sp. tf2-5]|nr:hypothetical protein SAMN04487852_10463 [Prevotella sp. tf2-5]
MRFVFLKQLSFHHLMLFRFKIQGSEVVITTKNSGIICKYRKKFVPSHPEMAIWWLMPPDVRESGESPELYLQL